ncbi:MAG: hypothetical protein WCG21_04190 [Eubacteriales bacterium]
MDNQQYAKEQINRYVYQVSRFLSGKNKEDIEKEIRSLIDDMLETKCQGREPDKADIEAVFAELGKPSALAAKYNDSKRYLIGPDLFPVYWSVLRIVILVAPAAMLLANLISIVTGTFSWENLGGIFSAAFMSFAIVTLIFAAVEWKGVSVDKLFEGEIELPPVPEKKARISRADPIVGLIFLSIFMCIFIFAPQYIGFWASGHSGYVSIFNVAVIKSIMGLFLICFGTSILKEIFKLIEGRYTLRLMIVTIFCNAINLALIIYIIRSFPIWNDYFPGQFLAAAQITGLSELQDKWAFITQNVFLGVVVFGTVVDTLSCIVKTLVYGLGRQDE